MVTSAISLILPAWLERLGGVGLILVGIADTSMVIPGSMDALTIVLSAHQRTWWPYYGLMATLGALSGAYVSYSLGRKGGKEALEKRVSHKRAEKIYYEFEKHGFWSVFIPALLPPPTPYTPFLLAAGALRFPRKKFFSIVAVARGLRYFLLAYLGSLFGKHIFAFFQAYYEPVLWIVGTLGIVGGLSGALYLSRRKRREAHQAS